MENLREAILTTIEKNSRIDIGELAIRLGTEEVEVANTLEALEKEGIICGYHTMIDWDKTSIEKGQSFVFSDGSWKDMSDSDIKTVLKTNKGQSILFRDNNTLKNILTDSERKAMQETDFAPGSCCIKALFI